MTATVQLSHHWRSWTRCLGLCYEIVIGAAVSLKQRLTFPFPFVHHQPRALLKEKSLTVETRTLPERITLDAERHAVEPSDIFINSFILFYLILNQW